MVGGRGPNTRCRAPNGRRREKIVEPAEIVGPDKIHAGIEQDSPHHLAIGRIPEAEPPPLAVGHRNGSAERAAGLPRHSDHRHANS